MTLLRLLLLLPMLALGLPLAAAEPDEAGAPYVPSPQSIVARMLELADVGPDDYVIDLGSGDGRIVLTAARIHGASGLGVEIRQDLVDLAERGAEAEGVADRVRFVRQDLFDTDVSRGTVVTLYLLPETIARLRSKLLLELAPGTRVLSHDYPIPNWRSEQVVELEHPAKVDVTGVARTVLYLYRVPADVHGRWTASVPEQVAGGALELEFAQRVTDVLGRVRDDQRLVALEEVSLRGRTLRFTLADAGLTFVGEVDGGTIAGTFHGDRVQGRWHARRS